MARSEQKYRVAHSQVGPWVKDHVFGESEFKRLHPLPDNPQTRDAGLIEDGEETYHAGLIRRLLDSGSITVAENDAETMPTPLGPENVTKIPAKAATNVPPAGSPAGEKKDGEADPAKAGKK